MDDDKSIYKDISIDVFQQLETGIIGQPDDPILRYALALAMVAGLQYSQKLTESFRQTDQPHLESLALAEIFSPKLWPNEAATLKIASDTPLFRHLPLLTHALSKGPIWQVLKKTCLSLGLSLSCAESMTGGLLGHLIVRESGSSEYFAGSLVTYTLEQKVELLAVDEKIAKACDCVSETVAQQMAINVAAKTNTEIGVSVTGFAEPPGDGGGPRAYYAVALKGALKHTGYISGYLQEPRVAFQHRVAYKILCDLIERIKN